MAHRHAATELPTCRVGGCKRATAPGILVCDKDADDVVLDLLGVPGLVLALEEAHRKALRFDASSTSPRVAPAEEESPIPFNPKASAARALLMDTLTKWVDLIAWQRGYLQPATVPHVLARWLAAQISWLRSAEIGPEAVTRIRAAIASARRVVDRPADRVYAGPCTGSDVDADGLLRECRADLYALPEASEVECPACGTKYPLEDRRAWLLSKAEDMLLPATELARAIDGLGIDVTPERIRLWASRGRIAAHGTTPAGRPMYRVGDVRDLIHAAAVRAAAKERQS